MIDDVDRIMDVMQAAFDPAYGEAWTHRQVSDALVSPYCRYILISPSGTGPAETEQTAGFAMIRRVIDEEELLLLAVKPEFQGRGLAGILLQQILKSAPDSAVTRVFLEMRDGNSAKYLYHKYGFHEIGRRKGYYCQGSGAPLDAITYSWHCQIG